MDYAARPGLAAGMKRMPTLRMPAIESPSLTPQLQLQPLMLGGGAGGGMMDAVNPMSISLVGDKVAVSFSDALNIPASDGDQLPAHWLLTWLLLASGSATTRCRRCSSRCSQTRTPHPGIHSEG